MTSTAPHLREDLLTPRFYTTEIEKAAKTDLEGETTAEFWMFGQQSVRGKRDGRG
jgi:magnesium-protoporphyrin IX monomethyl ester (oxidative) cyclase